MSKQTRDDLLGAFIFLIALPSPGGEGLALIAAPMLIWGLLNP